MKIYNPFKKISKLERELKDSLLDLDDLKRENERLSGKLEYLRENKENHETGMWCNGCKNLVKSMEDTAFGRKELRFCMLDNKRKDREIENE